MKNNYLAIGIVIVLLIGSIFTVSQVARDQFLAARQSVQNTPVPTTQALTPPGTENSFVLGARTKLTDCVLVNGLPDKECSPGAIFPNVTKSQVCTPGYSSSVRNVSQATKDRVFKEYGLPTEHQPGEYEVDHIISLELGGSNDISNLYPEPAEPRPGFHEKDKVENYLHAQVCSGAMSLQDAQQKISQNWLEVYQQINH